MRKITVPNGHRDVMRSGGKALETLPRSKPDLRHVAPETPLWRGMGAKRRGDASLALKRLTDVVVGAVLLACSLPVILPACIAIILETPGSPLYLQWRSGLHGRPFRIVKLRTMLAGADKLGPELTQHHDPRITRVGSFLRRWSIDELPQLANVLAGHMSLVGPRPELPSIVATYSPHHAHVLRVRPGMTGWAQVNGRDDLAIMEKLDLELQYAANRTTLWDMLIVAKTFRVVFTGHGAKR